MNTELGYEIIKAAHGRIGLPFSHHFKPLDLCKKGTLTLNDCMEQGMDDEGYDCSGLVIASLADVLGISRQDWPREFRHATQLDSLSESQPPRVGDTLVFVPDPILGRGRGLHVGIFATEQLTIHASGVTGRVEEGVVEGDFSDVRVIPAAILAGLW